MGVKCTTLWPSFRVLVNEQMFPVLSGQVRSYFFGGGLSRIALSLAGCRKTLWHAEISLVSQMFLSLERFFASPDMRSILQTCLRG